jgi:hypothetical protein
MSGHPTLFRRSPRAIALAGAVLVGGLSAGLAAQPSESSRPPISAEQRALVSAHVKAEERASSAAPSGFLPTPGSVLPDGIPLFWMPPSAGLNRYRYAIVGGRAVIVDPEGRRIIVPVE